MPEEKSKNMKRIFFLFILTSLYLALPAQTPADSIALTQAPWETVVEQTGLQVVKASLSLYSSTQRIYLAEADPACFEMKLVPFRKRQTVASAARNSNIAIAVNGSFFDTDTSQAVPANYLKSGGWAYTTWNKGAYDGAVGLDESGMPEFRKWRRTPADSVWQAQFEEVIVAGPLLILDKEIQIHRTDTPEERAPRTAIGQKADGTFVFFAVDGRQKGADGMTLRELAFVIQWLGCVQALNLDGGGSTTFWVDEKGTVNKPSDKVLFLRMPRAVANMVTLVARDQ